MAFSTCHCYSEMSKAEQEARTEIVRMGSKFRVLAKSLARTNERLSSLNELLPELLFETELHCSISITISGYIIA